MEDTGTQVDYRNIRYYYLFYYVINVAPARSMEIASIFVVGRRKWLRPGPVQTKRNELLKHLHRVEAVVTGIPRPIQGRR